MRLRSELGVDTDGDGGLVVFCSGVLWVGGALVERGISRLVKAVGEWGRWGLDVCSCGVFSATAHENVGVLQGARVPELVWDSAVLGRLIRVLL